MYDLDLRIPPGAKEHRVTQTWEVKEPMLLLSFFPHMHLRGKSFRYDLIHPDGSEEILLDVPRYDFNWQHRYVLAQPRLLPLRSRLRATAVYDNSVENPANPDPSAEVRTGTQSWEEMFNGYFDVVLADEDLTRPMTGQARITESIKKVFQPGVTILVCLVGGLFLSRKWIARALRGEVDDARQGMDKEAIPGNDR
jgi:hypothetical protein